MGGKSKVEVTADKLRWAIVRGEFLGEFMSSEAQMAEDLEVSRATLRGALTFLRAEGLVDSVPGVGWRAKKFENASFDVVQRMFEALEEENRVAAVRHLLAQRAQQVVGAVAALLRARAPAPECVKKQSWKLRIAQHSQQYAVNTLEMEDDFLSVLVADENNVPMRLAALQVQRAIKVTREWLHPTGYLRPMAAMARALVFAIENHEPGAVDLAFGAATLRDPLYEALLHERFPCCQIGNASADPPVG